MSRHRLENTSTSKTTYTSLTHSLYYLRSRYLLYRLADTPHPRPRRRSSLLTLFSPYPTLPIHSGVLSLLRFHTQSLFLLFCYSYHHVHLLEASTLLTQFTCTIHDLESMIMDIILHAIAPFVLPCLPPLGPIGSKSVLSFNSLLTRSSFS